MERRYTPLNHPKEGVFSNSVISLLISSALFAGFGNSLEPISVLSWLSIFLLIQGLQLAFLNIESYQDMSNLILFVLITQSLGFCIGFNSMLGYPSVSTISTLECIGFGMIYWILFSLLAIVPMYLFDKRYPNSVYLSYVFPVCFTMVTHSIMGNIFSTISAISNSVLDYYPLRQLPSLFGLASITFFVTLIATSGALTYLQKPQASTVFRSSLYTFFTLMVVTGFLMQSGAFYQKDVSNQITPSANVSCVFAQDVDYSDALGMSKVFGNTQARVDARDAIVLWSEEAVNVYSYEEEAQLVAEAQKMAAAAKSTYIGITYERMLKGQLKGINQFVLVTPSGGIAWNYTKAHPVPIVEWNVEAGPNNLPTYDSEYGRLGGAICFDLNYPNFILQAGLKKVDILLQPGWDWGALSSRHFEDNAVRAIENGVTLFRCTSVGESGTVTPVGRFTNRLYNGADPTVVSVFSLPLQPRIGTLYANGGFLFEWVLLLFALIIYSTVSLPESVLGPFHDFLVKSTVAPELRNGVDDNGVGLSQHLLAPSSGRGNERYAYEFVGLH